MPFLCCLVEMEFIQSFIHKHAHIFSHTYASVKCYNISVNVVVYLCTLMPELFLKNLTIN